MWERFRHADVIMERHQKTPREREHVVVVLGGGKTLVYKDVGEQYQYWRATPYISSRQRCRKETKLHEKKQREEQFSFEGESNGATRLANLSFILNVDVNLLWSRQFLCDCLCRTYRLSVKRPVLSDGIIPELRKDELFL